MEQRPVVEGDVSHHLEVAVLAGDGGQRGAGAEHHAHLIGRVHVDDAGGGSIDVVVVGAGVQGVQLALQIVDVALHAGQAGGDGLQGGVIQGLHLALVLLHQGLDLLVGVARGLIGRGVESLLGHLALVGLVLVVVGLVVDVRLAEVVLVVLNGLDQLFVLALLLFVDVQLALDAVLLHVEVGALDVSDEVALVDVGTLGDVQLSDGAGVAGHDVGLVGGLHRAAGLADVGAVVFGAPHHEEEDEGSRQENERVAERRQLFLHHDAAVLQIRKVLNFNRHITSSP